MTAETETKLDDDSKALRAAAAAENRDLNAGTDTLVPKGDEEQPGERTFGAGARKALYAKMKDLRKGESVEFSEAHDGVRAIEDAVAAEMRGSTRNNELDRHGHVDTEQPERGAAKPEQQRQAPAKEGLDRTTAERVTVKVNGKEMTVPKRDVDEAGGTEAYQKRRAAAIAHGEAVNDRTLAKADREEAARILEEARKRGASAPATSAADPASGTAPSGQDAPGSADDVQRKAESIAKLLYAGDPAKAAQGVAEILRASSNPATLDPEVVAQQVLQKLGNQNRSATAGAAENSPEISTRKYEIQRANEMFAKDYSEIDKDPELRQLAKTKYKELESKAENVGRDPIDIAREVGEYVQEKYLDPRKGVRERKRELLTPQPTGTTRALAEEDEPLLPRGSAYVEHLQRRRGTNRA